MGALHDTFVMAKRSLHHTVKSPDTIVTVVASPIAILLLFVYVFGGMFNSGGPVSYVNFITPGIAIMAVANGIAYAAFRLNNDLMKGIVNRFKTMPISPSSILNGHVVSSVVSNLFSVALVIGVAFLAGFRSDASVVDWLAFTGLIALFTLATSWLAMVFGLLAKTGEGAGAFAYAFLLLLFVSSAFVPTDSMSSGVRAFAENQPMTPIVEALRSLLTNGTAGGNAGAAVAWCAGMLVVAYVAALWIYKRKTI